MSPQIRVDIAAKQAAKVNIFKPLLSRPWVDVRDFKKGSGADWIEAINNSRANLGSQGGVVLLPPGIFGISASITNGGQENVHFLGSGRRATIIRPLVDGIDAFSFGDGASVKKYFSVKNLHIESEIARTSGAAIKLNWVSDFVADHISIENEAVMLNLVKAYLTRINNLNGFNRTASEDKRGIIINAGCDIYLNDIYLDCPPDAVQGFAGIDILEGGGIWMKNVDVVHFKRGLLVRPGNGKYVDWLFVMNSAFDYGDEEGIYLAPETGGTIRGSNFIGNWSSSNKIGFRTSSGGTIDGVRVIGHRSFNNQEEGIKLEGGTNLSFDAPDISGNNKSDAGKAGILVAADVSGWAVRNGRSGQMAGFNNTQAWGMYILTGASDNYIVQGNDFRGNITGDFRDLGTGVNKIVKDNLVSTSIDVASATTVTLPSTGDFFNITGTTDITSVTASWAGRRVVLKFAGILTFTDGSNLKLANNFVTSADATINLICDGTNWYEISRSSN